MTLPKHPILSSRAASALFLLSAGVLASPAVAAAFRRVEPRWLHVALLATLLSSGLVPLAGWLARRVGAVDRPDARKIHDVPTPRLGGAAVFLSFAIALWANGVFTPRLVTVVAASTLIFALGAADDMFSLGAGLRLIVQVAACGVLIAGGVLVKIVPPTVPYWWLPDSLLTVLWVLAATNAFNFLDGMDGLAGGLGLIAGGVLGLLAFRTGAADLGWSCVALLGACAGFLPFNFRPGRRALIFLGDSGSTFLGFLLATLAILGEWSQGDPVVSACVPVLVFFVPLFDLAYTSVERFASRKVSTLGQLLAYTGKDHIHHRLSAVLGSRGATVVFLYVFSACVGVVAVAAPRVGTGMVLILVTQVTVVAGLISALEISARRRISAPAATSDEPS
ncbi:MAG: undecaprenyl/decaprenyl-phosphate alpha-N-acetylglucosaminyl 1-phosphate transferase [Deltaproteobacteria bacterium]|nr:undecaprenyl/decaprenyl-phosphate alpha-N-acetylglucosaminyl 1-phosphate transferase [Deltaproteobacteria bacterium]